MDSHVRWTMSRPGPHQKHSLKESYTGSSKMIKNSKGTFVKRLGKATLHMLFHSFTIRTKYKAWKVQVVQAGTVRVTASRAQ